MGCARRSEGIPVNLMLYASTFVEHRWRQLLRSSLQIWLRVPLFLYHSAWQYVFRELVTRLQAHAHARTQTPVFFCAPCLLGLLGGLPGTDAQDCNRVGCRSDDIPRVNWAVQHRSTTQRQDGVQEHGSVSFDLHGWAYNSDRSHHVYGLLSTTNSLLRHQFSQPLPKTQLRTQLVYTGNPLNYCTSQRAA